MKKGIFLYPLLVSALISSSQLYAADDYLLSLEKESSNTQVDSAAEYADVAQAKKQRALTRFTTKSLPPNLNKIEFKIFLMDNLFDSYMSYLEFDQKKKDVVFQQYQQSQTPNVDIIKGMISRLSR